MVRRLCFKDAAKLMLWGDLVPRSWYQRSRSTDARLRHPVKIVEINSLNETVFTEVLQQSSTLLGNYSHHPPFLRRLFIFCHI